MESALVPSMWRETLLHPLVVHFPIALFIIAAFLELIHILVSAYNPTSQLREKLRFSILLLLVIAVPLSWAAIYTGEIAHDDVNRTICDPTVTDEHKSFAWISSYIFSGALFIAVCLTLESTRTLLSRQKFLIPIIKCIYLLLLLFGAAAIAYTGHLGASLVYQQAANVYVPSPECKEFE